MDTVALSRERGARHRKRLRESSPLCGQRKDCTDRDGSFKEETLSYVLRCTASPSTGAEKSGAAPPAAVRFGPAGLRLGRDANCCDVVLPSANVSRLHTVVSVLGEDVCVHDKSHNGTFINGRLVGRGRCAILHSGDLLSFVNPCLAEAQKFSYSLEGSCLSHSGHDAGAPQLQRAGMDRYVLGPSIGQGSFAVVRLGVNRETSEKVAVKILHKREFLSELAFTSLHLEIEMMRSMNHAHVVRVLDAFEAPDAVALVMEYVRGGDLFDYIVGRGRNPFTEDEARFLFSQLVEAVLYIHSRRIVHCDLKPENILVDVPSTTPSPVSVDGEQAASPFSVVDNHQSDAKSVSAYSVCLKLADFGVAKYCGVAGAIDDSDYESGEEESGQAVVPNGGTARYAAPEQLALATCSGESVGSEHELTAAVDVWALGVILYVLCAGGLPKNPQKDSKVQFSRHLSDLSAEAKDLIQSMMALQPEERATLHDVCNHPWLAGVEIQGKDLCRGQWLDDEDALSVTATLSPHAGRPSRTYEDACDSPASSSARFSIRSP